MNDYWNDPPEVPEPPECCGYLMTAREDGSLVCENCSRVIEPTPDIEPPELEEAREELPPADECPHGKQFGDCGECDYRGDIEYDAARERRFFRRQA